MNDFSRVHKGRRPHREPQPAGIEQQITYLYAMTGSGNQWRVHLACSHKLTVTRQELDDQQLFIGKFITCPECEQ